MKTTKLSPSTAPTPASANRSSPRILVPLDLAADSHKLLEYAVRLAKAENASICLLNVVDFGPFKSDINDSPMFRSTDHIINLAERHLRMLAHHEVPPDMPVRFIVRTGKTAKEVVKAAKGICADLIVLSDPKRNWLDRLFSGDPTRWIESHAPCSVVVLREANYAGCDCSCDFESHPAATALPA